MADFTVKINNNQILEKLRSIAFQKSKTYAYNKAYKLFLKAKKKMLQNFDNDDVTKELLEGMNDPYGAPNLSGTLGGAYGNLYAFLGFTNGKDPIAPLRELLDSNTVFEGYTAFRNNYGKAGPGSHDYYYFKVRLPDKTAIEAVTQMDWESSNSWVEAIENGLSNLSFFLSTAESPVSRSQGGIQVKSEISDYQFQTVQYLSKIFKEFREDL